MLSSCTAELGGSNDGFGESAVPRVEPERLRGSIDTSMLASCAVVGPPMYVNTNPETSAHF